MVQIAYRNRELTSYPKINHVFVSSKAVFTAGALSSQYQAAITLCKQSHVDTQNTIKMHNIEINPLAINLDVSGCSGANNKAQIKVKTHRPPCRFSLLSIQWYAISGFDDRRCVSLCYCQFAVSTLTLQIIMNITRCFSVFNLSKIRSSINLCILGFLLLYQGIYA